METMASHAKLPPQRLQGLHVEESTIGSPYVSTLGCLS